MVDHYLPNHIWWGLFMFGALTTSILARRGTNTDLTTIRFAGHYDMGTWGKMMYCGGSLNHGFATDFSLKIQGRQGKGWRQGFNDDTALNSICLHCSGGDRICSSQGPWGEWHNNLGKCNNGFNAFKIQDQRRQGSGDDTRANNIKLQCSREGKEKSSWKGKNIGISGRWYTSGLEGRMACPDGFIICGLQTRVQKPQGKRGDDTALNDVNFKCCRRSKVVEKSQHCQCKVEVKPGSFKPCMFPFKYQGKTFDGCTRYGSDKLWCPTQLDGDGTYSYGDWGVCKDSSCKASGPNQQCKCMVEVKPGSFQPCIFPFNYKGQTFHGCTSYDSEALWCPTQLMKGAYVNGSWGTCKDSSCYLDNQPLMTTKLPYLWG